MFSIEDLPTFNETDEKSFNEKLFDEKSFDEKAKSKRRQHEQFTLAFGKNSSNNNIRQNQNQIDLLDIKLPAQIPGNGKVGRVRAASKWDDKTLRTQETKNLKFPKCLPPPAHQTSHQTGLILDTRNKLKNGFRENRENNLKDEQTRDRSQSPGSRDKRLSRFVFVVYFDLLSGAFSTSKLVKTLFQPFSTFFEKYTTCVVFV